VCLAKDCEQEVPLLIASVVLAKSSKQTQLHAFWSLCWCCLWSQHHGGAEPAQPFCRSFLAKTQLKLRGSSLRCSRGGLQQVSALLPTGLDPARLLQEAAQEGTQLVPLFLSFLVLWAASGAVDEAGSGAESVLQDIFALSLLCAKACAMLLEQGSWGWWPVSPAGHPAHALCTLAWTLLCYSSSLRGAMGF